MLNEFSRTELLIGSDGLNKLQKSTVAIFGIGGVGSYAVEALARAGVGHLVLIDDDLICRTNINRQLHATQSTVGRPKIEAMRDRILDINPQAEVECHQTFYLPGNDELLREDYDYIIDAIDTVTAKIDLAVQAEKRSIPIISCMGVGNKLHPELLEITDIYKTTVCPLAKVLRKELKNRGVKSLKVVYSQEPPITPQEIKGASCKDCCVCPADAARTCTIRRQIPGSISFMPAAAGLILAGEVVRELIK